MNGFAQKIFIDKKNKIHAGFICGEQHEIELLSLQVNYATPYFIWQRSDNDGASWQNLPDRGEDVTSISVVNYDGTQQLYRVVIGESEEVANEFVLDGQSDGDYAVSDVVTLQCNPNICGDGENRLVVWKEDFKSVPRGERRECENLVNLKFAGKYNSSAGTNIGDGRYAVVSHSADGSLPSYNWFSGGTDHTGNKDGGFLIINNVDGGAPDVLLYEKKIDFDLCDDTWYYFSLYAMCISGGATGKPDAVFAHCNFTFEIIGDDGVTVLATNKSGDVPLSDYGISTWYNYGVSFNSGNNKNVTLRIYDSAIKNLWGNDMAIDDISLIACQKDLPENVLGVGMKKDMDGICGEWTQLELSGMSEWESLLPTVYCTWQGSVDGGLTWKTVPQSGYNVYTYSVPFLSSDEGLRYRVIISKDKASGEFIAENGYSNDPCSLYKISNVSTLTCHCQTPELSVVSDKQFFCTDKVKLTASANNSANISKYEWSQQDADTKEWNVIGGGKSISVFDKIDRTYCVVAWNDTCQSDSAFITIKAKKFERVPMKIAGVNAICENGSATLLLSPSVANKVKWYKKETPSDDFSVFNAGNSLQLTVSPLVETSFYAVTDTLIEQCLQGVSDTFTVKVDAPAKLSLVALQTAVCTNGEVTLTADYGTANTIVWEEQAEGAADFTAFANDLTTQKVVNPTKNTFYRIHSTQNGACPDTYSDAVSVTTEDSVHISIEPLETRICSGTMVYLVANADGEPDAVVWERTTDNETTTIADSYKTNDTPTQSCIYTATAYGKLCPSASESVSVTVDSEPGLSLAASQTAVCTNGEVTLTADYGTANTIVWEEQAEGAANFTAFANELSTQKVVNPTKNTFYRIHSTQNGACPDTYSDAVSVTTEDSVHISIEPLETRVCSGTMVYLVANADGEPDAVVWERTTDSETTPIADSYKTNDTPTQSCIYTATAYGKLCPSASESVSVTVDSEPVLSLAASQTAVCTNGEVTLTADYGTANTIVWEEQEEGAPDFTTFANDLSTQKVVNPTKNTFYRIHSTQNGACPDTYSNIELVEVEVPVELELSGANSVCRGENYTLNLHLKNAKKSTSVVLYESNDGIVVGQKKIIADNFDGYSDSIQYNLQKDVIFTLKATPDYCPEKEATIHVKVDTVPELYAFSATADSICKGDYVDIYTDFPFSENNLQLNVEPVGEIVTSNDMYMTAQSQQFQPNVTTRYTLTPKTIEGCLGRPQSISVHVSEPVGATVSDTTVCIGQNAPLNVTGESKHEHYIWSSSSDFSDTIAVGNKHVVLPDETTTYYVRATNGKCIKDLEKTIVVAPIPSVEANQENAQTITLTGVGGTGQYMFDFGNGFDYKNTIDDVIPRKKYNITISDDLGCISDTVIVAQFYELNIPRYFTPQGDGINDTWKITNLNKYAHLKVDIYNRYGKLLSESRDPDQEWDGIYNGHPLPSDDYWYYIIVYDINQTFTGHFTLIRK
ncbi:MAG: T9SS type B sorting domain-containing protein [Paludibacteraceae bacterium]|nr:T9SS type B sorting domain-containing protein [Paludibacteraceae bacterium]